VSKKWGRTVQVRPHLLSVTRQGLVRDRAELDLREREVELALGDDIQCFVDLAHVGAGLDETLERHAHDLPLIRGYRTERVGERHAAAASDAAGHADLEVL